MDKSLQDKAWASLPDDFRKEVREIWQEANARCRNNKSQRGYARCIKHLFGFYNLTAKEQLKPRFKVGQFAMFKGRRVEIIGNSEHYPQMYRVFVLTENYHTDAKESDLEPYTSPEVQRDAKGNAKETKESEKTFQTDENWKELNLCELLAGCEGMEFYSPLFGQVTLDAANECSITIKNLGFADKVELDSEGCYSYGGELMLYPSKEVRTWEGWQPPKKRWKPKMEEKYYSLQMSGAMNLAVNEYCNCYTDATQKALDSFNCFRTSEQAKEAAKRVREVLEKFHDEIGEGFDWQPAYINSDFVKQVLLNLTSDEETCLKELKGAMTAIIKKAAERTLADINAEIEGF